MKHEANTKNEKDQQEDVFGFQEMSQLFAQRDLKQEREERRQELERRLMESENSVAERKEERAHDFGTANWKENYRKNGGVWADWRQKLKPATKKLAVGFLAGAITMGVAHDGLVDLGKSVAEKIKNMEDPYQAEMEYNKAVSRDSIEMLERRQQEDELRERIERENAESTARARKQQEEFQQEMEENRKEQIKAFEEQDLSSSQQEN